MTKRVALRIFPERSRNSAWARKEQPCRFGLSQCSRSSWRDGPGNMQGLLPDDKRRSCAPSLPPHQLRVALLQRAPGKHGTCF